MNAKVWSLQVWFVFLLAAGCAGAPEKPALAPAARGTGDLGVIIERAAGRVAIVDTTERKILATVSELGDLSHASIVFSRDARYAFVFGRDGGLTKIDLLTASIVKRIVQSGNSIGGAISQDGRFIAVSNYTPGGVKVFDANTLELVADVPARGADGELSKVVGLVDLPGNAFVFSLYESGEIWTLQMGKQGPVDIRKYAGAGALPYDALISADGRYYIAGLFGEDGMTMVDLWAESPAPQKVLAGYGKGEQKLPVYKMPHLEGWALTGRLNFLPAVGRHEVLVVDNESWSEVDRIAVHGQPVFVVARPDGRQVWVNFAFPHYDTLQVIDVPSRKIVKELKPGKGVLHMEFTPRGEAVWVSVRDENRVAVYDVATFTEIASLPLDKPSGIFFTPRAHRIGM
jgi:protein NirF